MMEPEDLDTRTLALLLAGRLRDRVCESPVSTLAGAATVGYVLGWSMPSPLYRALASMAVRAVVMQAIASLLGSDEDEDLDFEEEDLDLAGSGGMPGDPRESDVPPYVA